jgi:transcriptional regulator with XRE-family HTH domain
MTTVAEVFAGRLRLARIEARISQEECAFRAEMHRTQISLVESAARMPRLETFVRLAGAVEVEPGELLGPIRWRPGVHTLGSFDLGEEDG